MTLDLPALRKRLDELAAAQADSRAQDWSDLMDSLGATFIHHGYELLRAAEERDALLALCVEMWDEQSRWSGPVASSHYRSDISARIKAIRLAKEPR